MDLLIVMFNVSVRSTRICFGTTVDKSHSYASQKCNADAVNFYMIKIQPTQFKFKHRIKYNNKKKMKNA